MGILNLMGVLRRLRWNLTCKRFPWTNGKRLQDFRSTVNFSMVQSSGSPVAKSTAVFQVYPEGSSLQIESKSFAGVCEEKVGILNVQIHRLWREGRFMNTRDR